MPHTNQSSTHKRAVVLTVMLQEEAKWAQQAAVPTIMTPKPQGHIKPHLQQWRHQSPSASRMWSPGCQCTLTPWRVWMPRATDRPAWNARCCSCKARDILSWGAHSNKAAQLRRTETEQQAYKSTGLHNWCTGWYAVGPKQEGWLCSRQSLGRNLRISHPELSTLNDWV